MLWYNNTEVKERLKLYDIWKLVFFHLSAHALCFIQELWFYNLLNLVKVLVNSYWQLESPYLLFVFNYITGVYVYSVREYELYTVIKLDKHLTNWQNNHPIFIDVFIAFPHLI